jgi:hypothetical protein
MHVWKQRFEKGYFKKGLRKPRILAHGLCCYRGCKITESLPQENQISLTLS